MDASTIREFVAQARPFQFKLRGGEVVRVPHGDWASLSPLGANLLVWKGNAPVTYAVALIEKIEPLAESRRKTAS
jgi:hypothetical protein